MTLYRSKGKLKKKNRILKIWNSEEVGDLIFFPYLTCQSLYVL